MSNFVIINGFDRSGSSAISRTLTKHPDVELIMQPFNSGFLRKVMYQPIEKSRQVDIANKFFSDLDRNILNNELINSHWHRDHSTTSEYVPGKIHLVKTTINHFAQRYMKNKFPRLDIWGIWRDPYEIMHSIQKNEFDSAWYVGAIEQLKHTVLEEMILREHFAIFFEKSLTRNQELALLIAVRSYFFFYYLDPDKCIVYEEFKEAPNLGLKRFIDFYGLMKFDFSKDSTIDMNIIGYKYVRNDKLCLSTEYIKEVELILAPLFELYKIKFQV